jgi:hypothetical protein
MLLASIALLAVSAVGLLLWLVRTSLAATRAALLDAESAATRHYAWSLDREVFSQSRETVVEAAQTATEAVGQVGSVFRKATRRVLRRP